MNASAGDPIGTVVLLHPAGLNSQAWGEFPEKLTQASGWDVVALDLLGHGALSHMPPPDGDDLLTTLAADVAGRTNGFKGPIVLLGASLGGVVALLVELEAPGTAAALVVSGTLFDPAPDIREMLRTRAERTRSVGVPGMLDETLERWLPPGADAVLAEQIRTMLCTANSDMNARIWDALSDLTLGDRLPKLTVPTRVLCGTADQASPPAISQALAVRIPGAEFFPIEGAGHLAPMECPAGVALIVSELLIQIERKR